MATRWRRRIGASRPRTGVFGRRFATSIAASWRGRFAGPNQASSRAPRCSAQTGPAPRSARAKADGGAFARSRNVRRAFRASSGPHPACALSGADGGAGSLPPPARPPLAIRQSAAPGCPVCPSAQSNSRCPSSCATVPRGAPEGRTMKRRHHAPPPKAIPPPRGVQTWGRIASGRTIPNRPPVPASATRASGASAAITSATSSRLVGPCAASPPAIA